MKMGTKILAVLATAIIALGTLAPLVDAHEEPGSTHWQSSYTEPTTFTRYVLEEQDGFSVVTVGRTLCNSIPVDCVVVLHTQRDFYSEARDQWYQVQDTHHERHPDGTVRSYVHRGWEEPRLLECLNHGPNMGGGRDRCGTLPLPHGPCRLYDGHWPPVEACEWE